ncbi:UNVERIFIED_CONTAM: phnA [Trichonephila clavipes]
MSLPNCQKCQSEYTYQDGDLLICPECSYEWKEGEVQVSEAEEIIKDANGNVLADGDSVTVVKDLKIKGSSSVVKVGTKVKSIRLVPDASDGHNIDCKIDGVGAMKLKSEFVKKV